MDDKAGGQINIAGVPPYKNAVTEVIKSRLKIIKKLNIDIITNTELTINIIKQISPDVLIVATGSKTIMPGISGVEQKNVITARDVLNGALVGNKIVMIGGGIVGCETADWLSENGADVTVIEMLKSVAREISPASRYFLLKRLADKKVKILTKTTVKEIFGNKVTAVDEMGEITIEGVDNIILATGAKPVNDLELKARGLVPEIHVIGDAGKPGKILDAVRQAAEVGRSL
jgi:pyruvate/2-oxoglutarate dehydrogenase complex dihydrolipoamide dehydrogenase (E3) component